jgi:hypothetical protein
MPAWRAGKERTINLSEDRIITPPGQFQPPARNIHRPIAHPLRGALLHASQTKLLLRRARSEEGSYQKTECLTRLLQGLERICASLEWLCGGRPKAKAAPAISVIDADPISAGGVQ